MSDIRCPHCREYQDGVKSRVLISSNYERCWKCKKVYSLEITTTTTYKTRKLYKEEV